MQLGPRDRIELELTGIWESVLNPSRPIQPGDNFFLLGGDSMKAMRMLLKIRKVYGLRLPMASLLGENNLASLAIQVRQKFNPEWTPLVCLRRTGNSRPFFMFHPAGGTVAQYYSLSNLLGPDQPVYGFENVRPGRGHPKTLKSMMDEYLDELLRVQPEGPYRLGGLSLGGLLSLETAHRLIELGHEVELIALFGTRNPTKLPNELPEGWDQLEDIDESMAGRTLINRLIHHGEADNDVVEKIRSLSDEEQLEVGLQLIRDRALLPSDYGASQIHELFHAHVACVLAHQSYVARPIGVTVDLFVPECDLDADFSDWSDTLESVRLHVTDGDHSNQLSEPHVHAVAKVLRDLFAGG